MNVLRVVTLKTCVSDNFSAKTSGSENFWSYETCIFNDDVSLVCSQWLCQYSIHKQCMRVIVSPSLTSLFQSYILTVLYAIFYIFWIFIYLFFCVFSLIIENYSTAESKLFVHCSYQLSFNILTILFCFQFLILIIFF